MFHLGQASFAEFDADFGAKGRVAWGSSSPTTSLRTLSAEEVNEQWDVNATQTEEPESATCNASSDPIEVMSADDLLSRLQVQRQPELSNPPRTFVTRREAPVVLLPKTPPLLLVRCMPERGQPPPRLLTAVSATLKVPEVNQATGAQNGQSIEVVGGYKVGDLCEIFSHSGQVWCPGEVKALRSVNGTLHVEYLPPGAGEGGERSKMIKADSELLRRRDNRGESPRTKTETEPWIEWSPKSEYLLGQMGEVVVYDANGAGKI
jgi:hypothetical protein